MCFWLSEAIPQMDWIWISTTTPLLMQRVVSCCCALRRIRLQSRFMCLDPFGYFPPIQVDWKSKLSYYMKIRDIGIQDIEETDIHVCKSVMGHLFWQASWPKGWEWLSCAVTNSEQDTTSYALTSRVTITSNRSLSGVQAFLNSCLASSWMVSNMFQQLMRGKHVMQWGMRIMRVGFL